MEAIAIKNLTFAYSENSDFSLNQISLQVEQGEILLITGVSGCGKTTLLRHLKQEYMPQGFCSEDSEIWIGGRRIQELDEKEQAAIVGFVGQNVEDAQVTDKVWHELAFGLENLGYAQDVMQRKIAEMVAFFGLDGIYHEKLCNLSGGQKQMVNLAAVMVMEPEVLVLDEPTSQLDPIAATEFFRMIEKINRELGTTIVMTEHRLEEVFAMSHRICVMEQGSVIALDAPWQIARDLYEANHVLAKALPSAAKIYLPLECGREQVPITVNEGRNWLKGYVKEHRPEMWGEMDFYSRRRSDSSDKTNVHGKRKSDHFDKMNRWNDRKLGPLALHADEIWFRYERDGKDILKACSLKLEKGKITAILGGNGAGKSTLLNVLAGHFTPYLGKVEIEPDAVGMLPQNPQAMFAKKTVEEELLFSQEMIDDCDLQTVRKQHPFDLSGGQMQKLALAKLLLDDKDILLLDEPSKGMDYDFKEYMGKLLKQLVSRGKTVLMVSHDVEFCAKYADVCGLFFDGHIVSFTDCRSFFLRNRFYTTSVARMCRDIMPEAMVVEDVLQVFGCEGKEEISREMWNDKTDGGLNNKKKQEEKEQEKKAREEKEQEKKARGKNNKNATGKTHRLVDTMSSGKDKGSTLTWLLSLIIIFVVMPITIYVGHTILLQRKYYFISLLLVLEAIVCFFLRFEKRKPKVREIVVVAVMSAIVVAARTAFYMIPNVKPMAALVILTGIGLGAEAGFLVGATAMLVSDIFFGQGPWTPWQMFAMGLLGFLAGVVFKNSEDCSRKKKLAICIFGALSVVLIYGGIMNPASVLMYQEGVNMEMILSACVLGLPYDVMHGMATFAFLWIGCRPLLEKLKRVREKYHFML